MSISERASVSDAADWQALIAGLQAAMGADQWAHANGLFLELQTRAEKLLLAVALRKGPADEAEEIVASALYEFYKILMSGEPIKNAKALLVTIVRRRSIDALRRRYKQTPDAGVPVSLDEMPERTVQSELSLEDRVVRQEAEYHLANSILDKLPEHLRTVLIARHAEGLSVAETMATLDLSEDKVKKWTKAALADARRIAEELGCRHEY